MGDVSSEDDDGDSDEDEEVKGEEKGPHDKNPANDVAMSLNGQEKGRNISEEHKMMLREVSKNFTIRFR